MLKSQNSRENGLQQQSHCVSSWGLPQEAWVWLSLSPGKCNLHLGAACPKVSLGEGGDLWTTPDSSFSPAHPGLTAPSSPFY